MSKGNNPVHSGNRTVPQLRSTYSQTISASPVRYTEYNMHPVLSLCFGNLVFTVSFMSLLGCYFVLIVLEVVVVVHESHGCEKDHDFL